MRIYIINSSSIVSGIQFCSLTLSTPQDVTNVIKTKVKVKGLGRNGSYLVGFSIFFHGSMKKFNQLAKKKTT